MNAKILSVLGVMALMVAAWFFYKEDVKVKPAVPQAPEATYEVTEIGRASCRERVLRLV